MFKEIWTNTDPLCFALFWGWLDRFIESCAMSTWPRSNKCSATLQNLRTQNASHHPEEISTVISCQAVLCQHSEKKHATSYPTERINIDAPAIVHPSHRRWWPHWSLSLVEAAGYHHFCHELVSLLNTKIKECHDKFHVCIYELYTLCPKHYIYIWLHSINTFRYCDMWL